MPYKIERIHEPDALLVTLTDPFEPRKHALAFFDALNHHFDNESKSIVTILDVRGLTISVQKLLAGMNAVMDNEDSPPNHPMSARYIFVSESKVMQSAKKIFFRFNVLDDVQVVATVDEAKMRIAAQASEAS